MAKTYDKNSENYEKNPFLHSGLTTVSTIVIENALIMDSSNYKKNLLQQLTMLDLLAVTWRFLQGLNDQRGSRGHHLHTSLSVLDDELHRHLEALPVPSGFHDVFTDLFWRQTQGTNLGGQRRGGGRLSSNTSQTNCTRSSVM